MRRIFAGWNLARHVPPASRLRRERLAAYERYRRLFELEIARPEAGFPETVALLRYRAMLALASLLFRFGIPGALDLCDAAVFRMVRIAYLQAAH